MNQTCTTYILLKRPNSPSPFIRKFPTCCRRSSSFQERARDVFIFDYVLLMLRTIPQFGVDLEWNWIVNTSSNIAFFPSLSDSMQSLCKNHFLQQLYRKIDGAVLWSRNERNLDCVITFQTHSILQRFMLRFDFLQLDCNDHLYIYDGAHAVGPYKVSKLFGEPSAPSHFYSNVVF